MEALQVDIVCSCQRAITLRIIGGQYQDSYVGVCECGRDWLLEDLSEDLTEEVK